MNNGTSLSNPRLTKAGIGRLLTVVMTLAVTAAIFFLTAGTLEVSRGWLYYGGLLAYLVIAMSVIVLFFPEAIETVNARGKLNKDVKTWDKVFGLAYTALTLLQPAVAGWDVGRARSFEAPWAVSVVAFALTIMAYAFVHWAMISNKHAETGVRIQEDRHHAVVSSGPYRIVRHPFYISLIAAALLYPLAVSSLYALVPGVVMALLFIWRTAREDETLRRELDGYENFTTKTRYRLVPGVW
jgi:protein-S-isoprenylcysteine O-methyltransferase Ste14